MPGPFAGTGPPGPQGQDDNYVHYQAVASMHWIVPHGLGKVPSITCRDFNNIAFTGGREDDADDPLNISHLYFGVPLSGIADCN